MTTRIGAAVAAGFLAVGILVGAAGTIVVRDVTTADIADHTRGMAGMMSMMGGGGMAVMMSMMGGGAPMGPNASTTADDHALHHALPAPEATR